MKDQYSPMFTYQDFAKDFDAYMYDPDWWADLIEDSGAKFVVITAKHHEGYTMWPSNVSFSWNSKDVGPNKDLVGELMLSIRTRTDVHFGVYHSLYEWFNPLFLQDQENSLKTNNFVTRKTMPELYELVNKYQPEVIWSDGDTWATDTYWNSTGFLAWLYNESPVRQTVVVNDRWGIGAECTHGGYWTCQDRYNPGHVIAHKWENAFTIDKDSWGYRREAVLSDFLTDLEIISTIAETVSCGGNVLINVGPRKDGRIDPLMEERLRNMGKWLRINGEAIYGTKPWVHQNETSVPVWYTAKQSTGVTVYAIVLKWPTNGTLVLENVNNSASLSVSMLGYNRMQLPWSKNGNNGPGIVVNMAAVRFVDLPSYTAWVLRIDGLNEKQRKLHHTVVVDSDNQNV